MNHFTRKAREEVGIGVRRRKPKNNIPNLFSDETVYGRKNKPSPQRVLPMNSEKSDFIVPAHGRSRELCLQYGLSCIPAPQNEYQCGRPVMKERDGESVPTHEFEWYVLGKSIDDAVDKALKRLEHMVAPEAEKTMGRPMPFGKYKGRAVKTITDTKYLEWLLTTLTPGTWLQKEVQEALGA